MFKLCFMISSFAQFHRVSMMSSPSFVVKSSLYPCFIHFPPHFLHLLGHLHPGKTTAVSAQVPMFTWTRSLTLQSLRADLIAGLTVPRMVDFSCFFHGESGDSPWGFLRFMIFYNHEWYDIR